jgi:hypothetical protein
VRERRDERVKGETMDRKNVQLNFGEGKVSVSSGRRLADNVLVLEPNRGVGEIGQFVPTRPKDALIVPDEDGVVLSFKNAASVQVVIEELEKVKSYFTDPLTDEDALRLRGAHEALEMPIPERLIVQ